MRFRNVLIAVLLLVSTATACIWDNDTLRDEQRGLPGVFEVLVGQYERRSDFFYHDRIDKMKALLARDANNESAYDNLAVALFRVGQHDQAIATLAEKEKRFPDRYTTASNLATFHMLSGDSASAIPLLEKALKVNPDAHFGREKYQLMLAKYLVAAKDAEEYSTEDFLGNQPFRTLPSTNPATPSETKLAPNYKFAFANWHEAEPLGDEDAAAMKGILGMIRFGTDKSPDLYYALGNLLTKRGDRNLAVRAYARAIDLMHPRSADIKDLSRLVGGIISGEKPTLEVMQKERDAGQAWAKKYMDYTDDLIRARKDPEDEKNFDKFYQRAGVSMPGMGFSLSDWIPNRASGVAMGIIVVSALGMTLTTSWLIRRWRRWRAAGSLSPQGRGLG